jgi:hypothetical protein
MNTATNEQLELPLPAAKPLSSMPDPARWTRTNLSAWYGLLRLDDDIVRYEMRLGHRHSITADGLRDQAEQLGVLNTTDVTVLAPRRLRQPRHHGLATRPTAARRHPEASPTTSPASPPSPTTSANRTRPSATTPMLRSRHN